MAATIPQLGVPAIGLLTHGKPPAAYVSAFLGVCAGVRGLSPHTLAAYNVVLRAFAAFCDDAGLSTPAAVTPQAIEAYLGGRRMRGSSPATLMQHRGALASFFSWLTRENVVTRNAARESYPIRRARRLPDFLSAEEQDRILRALRDRRTRGGQRAVALVAMALLTGLRASELGALRLEDLHPESAHLRVIGGKGAKDRLIPLHPWLSRVLTRYLGHVRPLFPYASRVSYVFVGRECARGAPVSGRVLSWIIGAACAPIVGRPISAHTLRHSYATRLVDEGADLETVRALLGHESLATTGRYLHLGVARLTEAVRSCFAGGILGEREPTPEAGPALVSDVVELPPVAASPPGPHPFADPAVRARLRAARRARGRLAQ